MVVLNVKKLAVLRANEVALTQATKQMSQLHDKACVENARLCHQEAVLTTALGLQETEEWEFRIPAMLMSMLQCRNVTQLDDITALASSRHS